MSDLAFSPSAATGCNDPIAAAPTSGGRIRALLLFVALTVWTRAAEIAARVARRLRDQRGQATTEYALVLLAAALVALLVVAWATAGGGAARISRLFNRVVDAVIDRV